MHRVHGPVLADPVDAADALLEPDWRPWQLQVDDQAAALLEIQAFACGIRGQEHLHGSRREALEHLPTLRGAQAAVELHAVAKSASAALSVNERVAIFGEDDRRLARAAQQPADARAASLSSRSARAREREDRFERRRSSAASARPAPPAPRPAPRRPSVASQGQGKLLRRTAGVRPSSASRRSTERASDAALLQARRSSTAIARRAAAPPPCRSAARRSRAYEPSARVHGRFRRRCRLTFSHRVVRWSMAARRRRGCAGRPAAGTRPFDVADAAQPREGLFVAGMRRRRQHHQRARALAEKRRRGVAIRPARRAVRLVDDTRSQTSGLERAHHLRPLHVVDRRDDQTGAPPTGSTPDTAADAGRASVVESSTIGAQARTGAQLVAPLLAQGRRSRRRARGIGAALERLGDDEARLYRLAEPDFVGDQDPAATPRTTASAGSS